VKVRAEQLFRQERGREDWGEDEVVHSERKEAGRPGMTIYIVHRDIVTPLRANAWLTPSAEAAIDMNQYRHNQRRGEAITRSRQEKGYSQERRDRRGQQRRDRRKAERMER
jgi:hypothetical protein